MSGRALSRWLGAVVAAAALAVPASVVLAGPAGADTEDTGWVIEQFDVLVDVASDGTIAVTEDITVNFNDLERHGIFRVIPARYELSRDEERALVPDGLDPDTFLRAFDFSSIAVSSSAPADTEITRPDRFGERNLRIRIGDPDVTVTGRQNYRISYEVTGALNTVDGVDELNWNATGHEWPVPIRSARMVVRGQPVAQADCYHGAPGSTAGCDELDTTPADTSVGYAVTDLHPGEGMTVAVGFPPDTVAVPPPRIVEQWTLQRALVGSPAAVPLALLTGLLSLGSVGMLVSRQSRDRVTRGGQTVDGRPEDNGAHARPEDNGAHARRPLLAPRAAPVRYRPPAELRPAQLGVIVDERVDPVDVSATIVDFAVRGYVTISETTSGRLRKRTDWSIARTDKPDADLLPFERTLLTALFKTGSPVSMSDLTGTFSSDYKKTSEQLYADAVERGWFPRSPEQTRRGWLVRASLAVLAAIGIFVVATMFTTIALAAVPLVLAALVLLAVHGRMPHRTPKGSSMLAETLGFREFIATAEAGRMEFAEQENLFETYLPYAIVFGEVDRWASAFAHLGAAATAGVGAWYVTSSGGHDLSSLSSGLSSFSHSVGSGLATTPSSSGSSGGGSSGGGGGGGGGGSW